MLKLMSMGGLVTTLFCLESKQIMPENIRCEVEINWKLIYPQVQAQIFRF